MALTYDGMTAEEFTEILPFGSIQACLGLTNEWKSAQDIYAHRDGAEFLYWQYQDSKGTHLLCEKKRSPERDKYGPIGSYRLTPLGIKLQTLLKEKFK